MNHLYIQTAFLGDLLLSIPTLREIRYWSPQSTLTLVCRRGYGPLMQELGLCDEVIEVDKKDKKDLFKKMAHRKFATVFCPHQSMTSHKLVRSLQAEQKIGYKTFWNQSYFDIRVPRNLLWPEAIRQLQLLAAVSEAMQVKLEAFAQKPNSIPPWAEMSLKNLTLSTENLRVLVNEKIRGFKLEKPYICIAPGSVWETKRWQAESYVKVATEFARNNFQILILGAPDERELCERLQKQTPNSFSLAGHCSVLQSLSFISKAKGLVCNDSGAMHMASVVACPTVAIFGPTVQELGYKPWNPKAVVLEDDRLLCRPCGQHGGRYCPITTHVCMKNIKPEKVIEVAQSLFV